MTRWLRSFADADSQTKYFVLTWAFFGLAIILSTLFVYGRMDYVRTGKQPPVGNTLTTQPH